MKDINHPIRSLEIQQNFKNDTGLDWKSNLTEYLLYVNIYALRENAAGILGGIGQVRDEVRWVKEGIAKK